MRRKAPSVAVAFHRLRRTVFASVKAGLARAWRSRLYAVRDLEVEV